MSSGSQIRGIAGRGVPVRGDDIDTDRIIPARYLRCVTFDGLGEHAFEDDRKAYPGGAHPFDREEFQGASVLVVNRNFGCGSSREHAPQSLARWGIRGIIGESFAEIFFGNCVAMGIPCFAVSAVEVARLQDGLEENPSREVVLDVENRVIDYDGRSVPAELPEGVRRAYLSGTWDSAGLLLENPDEVNGVATSLPYVAGWGED